MKSLIVLLLIFASTSQAQPPCPASTNMCAMDSSGVTTCEALGPKATDGSYLCIQQPRIDAAFLPSSVASVPEVGGEGSLAALMFLAGWVLISLGRRRTRSRSADSDSARCGMT